MFSVERMSSKQIVNDVEIKYGIFLCNIRMGQVCLFVCYYTMLLVFSIM
jgi:hypothetical protein